MIDIRRIVTQVEDIHHEFGPPALVPLRRGAIAAVLTNPFAGHYVKDILPMMDALQPVGIEMAQRLRAAMDVPAERIESYGKGGIVGLSGELEHANAMLTTAFATPLRDAVGGAEVAQPLEGAQRGEPHRAGSALPWPRGVAVDQLGGVQV